MVTHKGNWKTIEEVKQEIVLSFPKYREIDGKSYEVNKILKQYFIENENVLWCVIQVLNPLMGHKHQEGDKIYQSFLPINQIICFHIDSCADNTYTVREYEESDDDLFFYSCPLEFLKIAQDINSKWRQQVYKKNNISIDHRKKIFLNKENHIVSESGGIPHITCDAGKDYKNCCKYRSTNQGICDNQHNEIGLLFCKDNSNF